MDFLIQDKEKSRKETRQNEVEQRLRESKMKADEEASQEGMHNSGNQRVKKC